jgi:hypothetical protein
MSVFSGIEKLEAELAAAKEQIAQLQKSDIANLLENVELVQALSDAQIKIAELQAQLTKKER